MSNPPQPDLCTAALLLAIAEQATCGGMARFSALTTVSLLLPALSTQAPLDAIRAERDAHEVRVYTPNASKVIHISQVLEHSGTPAQRHGCAQKPPFPLSTQSTAQLSVAHYFAQEFLIASMNFLVFSFTGMVLPKKRRRSKYSSEI